VISLFHAVTSPNIINHSFESDSITIYWTQDDTVKSYKIQYNFTIRECTDEMDTPVTNHEIMERNNYTIHNSTNMPVEEDSDYNISLVAINSDVSSPAAIIRGRTKQAGTIII
jgi:hypothetical protein